MNPHITEYINNASKEQKETMEAIRKLIHESVLNTTEEFKWNRPVFKADKDFAYLKTAQAYITLGFFNFQKLNDPKNLLEGTGKDMRHIKLKSTNDIDKKLLVEWFKASVI